MFKYIDTVGAFIGFFGSPVICLMSFVFLPIGYFRDFLLVCRWRTLKLPSMGSQ